MRPFDHGIRTGPFDLDRDDSTRGDLDIPLPLGWMPSLSPSSISSPIRPAGIAIGWPGSGPGPEHRTAAEGTSSSSWEKLVTTTAVARTVVATNVITTLPLSKRIVMGSPNPESEVERCRDERASGPHAGRRTEWPD